MKNLYYSLLAAALAIAASAPADAQLVINELMQSNIDCIMDDIHEFPDSWVELHNTSSTAVNLNAYSIGTSEKAKKAWQLPDYMVPPQGYVVIYCDKAAQGRHTDFRLDSGKGACAYLFLNGEITDKVEDLKKQPAPNVAWGRKTEGSDEWGYQASATPGKANCGSLVKTLLPDPIFSQAGRVASDKFSLTISLPEDAPEGTVIRYTTNGTEPTASSAQVTGDIPINKTTTIRAVAMCDGYITPRSVAQSYIFFPREMTLPIVSMLGDSKYFNDSSNGIFAGNNYQQNWRRPVNLELFMEPGEASVINQLCETRVKGGATRNMPLKSLALYANKRFGTKRFTCEFFPEDAPGMEEWKSFELRNSGNDFDYLYFRDALIQRVMGRHVDLDWQPWQPAIFMLNGEYKGMLNIRPRSNEDFIYTFYDELEDIEMFENWEELKTGTGELLAEFKTFYGEHGHTLAEYEERMDVEEFLNLMIMNLFYDNKDFPANNIVMWRPQAEGSRWRWIAKDTDFGLGLYGRDHKYNTIAWVNDNNYDTQNFGWGNTWDGTRLFRRLMEIDEVKDMFLDRCAIYISDFMNERTTNATLDEMRALINYEYPNHRRLFNPWWPNYDQEVSHIKNWVRQRPAVFLKYVQEYYKVGNAVPMTVDKGRTDDIRLTANGIPVSGRDLDGYFYAGRTLRLTATPAVKGWKVRVTNGSSTTETHYDGSELSFTFPQATRVTITSEAGESGVDDLEGASNEFDFEAPFSVTDLTGCNRGTFSSISALGDALPAGVYILSQSGVSVRHIVK
ncbi:MAG: CotH kinase family protein [Muribaculaceae bacterium]|nr:CotH kinase family protein [Muribaculaceae bacterium]